ncbi:MAG: protein-disulfide reductase DsbD domain-containing protein [Bauldia litoralis]|uniref:protein-disulfide reductase DsbD domain-containing protein n=1 Tax=Bauldia litoralis TaxID=665467 RepID=UPI003298BD77
MRRNSLHFTGLVLFALGVGLATSSSAEVGAWSEGDRARVRLLAGGIDADGALQGAIEIELAPGWHTYWRSPGAVGIPPQADFSTSSNVGDIAISYPVPSRYDDGYAISNVYEGRVVLPLTIAPGDGPVSLRLSLDIGVCEEVCIPEHFDAALDVGMGASDAVANRAIAEAWKAIPGPAEPGVLAVDDVPRQGGTDKRPEFDVALVTPPGEPIEVFVEGPTDWYAAVPELVSEGDAPVYRVMFDRLGARTPIDGADLRVTIVTPDRAVEQKVRLD